MQCNICNAEDTKPVRDIQSPYIDKKYTLYYCNNCYSSFFDKNQYDIDLNQIYNQEYCNKSQKFKKVRYWDNQVKYISNLIGRSENLNILDIGCRTGDFLYHWNPNNNLHGIEINDINAEIAKSRGIKVFKEFAENIDFDIQFDVITCYAIIEHLFSPMEFLEKLTRNLKPGGILVVMIPTIECNLVKKLERKNIQWHMFSPPQHINFFSRNFLDNYFKENGINLLNRYYISGGMRFRYKDKEIIRDDFDYIKQFYDGTYHIDFSYLNKVKNRVLDIIEERTFMSKIPYYDHMYSYYKNNGELK